MLAGPAAGKGPVRNRVLHDKIVVFDPAKSGPDRRALISTEVAHTQDVATVFGPNCQGAEKTAVGFPCRFGLAIRPMSIGERWIVGGGDGTLLGDFFDSTRPIQYDRLWENVRRQPSARRRPWEQLWSSLAFRPLEVIFICFSKQGRGKLEARLSLRGFRDHHCFCSSQAEQTNPSACCSGNVLVHRGLIPQLFFDAS